MYDIPIVYTFASNLFQSNDQEKHNFPRLNFMQKYNRYNH